MKNIIIIAVAIVGLSWTMAPKESETVQLMEKVNGDDLDKKPEFIGGQDALFAFIGENVVYPNYAKEKNIEGTSHIGFNVQANGKITDAKIVKSAAPILDEEALRVINMMPDWKPGVKNGEPVKVEMVLPITFKF